MMIKNGLNKLVNEWTINFFSLWPMFLVFFYFITVSKTVFTELFLINECLHASELGLLQKMWKPQQSSDTLQIKSKFAITWVQSWMCSECAQVSQMSRRLLHHSNVKYYLEVPHKSHIRWLRIFHSPSPSRACQWATLACALFTWILCPPSSLLVCLQTWAVTLILNALPGGELFYGW